jgi:hypothetical protein
MREGKKEKRDAIRESGGNPGKGILRTRPILHHEHARWFPVTHSSVAIRHIDADAFLTTYYWAYTRRYRVFNQGRRWKAEECGHTLALEYLDNGVPGSHLAFPSIADAA